MLLLEIDYEAKRYPRLAYHLNKKVEEIAGLLGSLLRKNVQKDKLKNEIEDLKKSLEAKNCWWNMLKLFAIFGGIGILVMAVLEYFFALIASLKGDGMGILEDDEEEYEDDDAQDDDKE